MMKVTERGVTGSRGWHIEACDGGDAGETRAIRTGHDESSSNEDEDYLLRAARRGDAQAFIALVNAHEPRLRALTYRVLRDHDLVPDAMQETVLRAFRSLHTYRGGSAFGTWLYRVAYTSALDLVSQSKRQADLVEREKTKFARCAPDTAELVADQELLSQALDSLSPEHRAVVYLCIQQDLDHETAAAILDVPYGTVGSRLSYARDKLRKVLTQEQVAT